MIKVKVKEIKAGTKTGISIFHGEGDAVKGFFIAFEVIEGSGMFYAGQNEGVAIPGRTYSFWFAVETAGQALAALQSSAETVNYEPVSVHQVYQTWRNGAWMDFSTAEEAVAVTRSFAPERDIEALEHYGSAVNGQCRKILVCSEPVCTDAGEILNLTQHAATAEQVEAGVVEPEEKGAVQAALTFDAIPTTSEMADRAAFLARIAVDSGCKRAMIGGAPFFMAPLERALLAAGITPVYAFSVRDSVEQPDGNGGVRKINVFRHVGFVEAAQ
jgi:hypothetical protein